MEIRWLGGGTPHFISGVSSIFFEPMQYPEPCLVGTAWSWHHGGTYFSFYGSVSQPAFLAVSALTEVEILIMRCPGVFLDLFNTANLGRFTVAPPPLLFTFPFFSFRAIGKLLDD